MTMSEDADFQIDWEREKRTGVPEAVLCGHKSTAQIGAIIRAARTQKRRLLLTRIDDTTLAALDADGREGLDHDPLSRTAILGGDVPPVESGIGIVAAGTSDMPMAREAARTLAFNGYGSTIVADVGVAGLWRLMARIEEIRRFKLVIACAGMEGALFSVLAGLVQAPLIAVPTSVGYGVADGGTVALNAALASCSPGVVVVNIDNGFGAAGAAIKMLRVADRDG
jgi:hypothetical protein